MSAEDETPDESSTRIFLSGLPPKFSSEQLRDHVAGKFQVTDAHVIPDRRIGFVGFPSHTVAKDAAHYYDKTFIRMSKISANLARSVEVKRNAAGQVAPISQKDTRNQKQDFGQGQLDQRPQKRRRIEKDGTGEEETGAAKSKSFHEQVQPHKQDQEGTEFGSANITAQTPEALTTEEISRSDSDWLRGKTSRLLDLVEPGQSTVSNGEVMLSFTDNDPGEEQKSTAQAVSQENPSSNLPTVKIPNARLFVRNLPFDVDEDTLRSKFETHGRISDIHIVRDTRTSTGKGLGFVQFVDSDDAEKAIAALDGKDFQGRLMHILPASDQKSKHLSDFEISKLPLKQQKALKRKTDATVTSFNWNSLYMNPDAVLASVADRLGVSRNVILDPTSSGAAVKQAHAETSVITETKGYLRRTGVNVDSFQSKQRDDRTILLKNFPFGMTVDEITKLLSPFGELDKVVLPPTGTMAIARFTEAANAVRALKSLAYSNIKGSVLYLEKAPRGILDAASSSKLDSNGASSGISKVDDTTESSHGTTSSIFVRNLNFATNSARLTEVFKPLSGFLSARVKTRTDPARPGEVLSMGFGFVEFRTQIQAEAAVSVMNTHRLDGHELSIQLSHKAGDTAEQQRQESKAKKQNAQKTKIIIKNLPFEVSKKDVRALFGAYGQLRTVRVPRKFDNSTRGFAFAEFLTPKEAQSAMEALSNTHLLGRRLVLQFAEGEIIDPEDEIRALEKKVGHQTDLIQLKKMTGSGRRKFNVEAREDLDAIG